MIKSEGFASFFQEQSHGAFTGGKKDRTVRNELLE
jgi:hypothetical protein